MASKVVSGRPVIKRSTQRVYVVTRRVLAALGYDTLFMARLTDTAVGALVARNNVAERVLVYVRHHGALVFPEHKVPVLLRKDMARFELACMEAAGEAVDARLKTGTSDVVGAVDIRV